MTTNNLSMPGANFGWWTKRGAGIIFDTLHGVDTSTGVPAEILEIASTNRDKALAYDTTPWQTLSRSLRLASLRAEGFTFVDVGCGKGKVLLSALTLPFKRVVGVEFSSYLCRIAKNNIDSARFIRRRCSNVQVVCADATEYPTPSGPVIFFFYNPFIYDIMEIVIGNIVTSYLRLPRPLYLILYAMSSSAPRINEFLCAKSGGRARRRVSTSLGERSVNIFELPNGQLGRTP
jgi:SAM-dependent methyltransferase